MIVIRGLSGWVAATVAVVFLVGASAWAGVGDASGGIDATCVGGSVPAGSYLNLNIDGVCNVDAGSVKVENNVTVLSGGTLVAAFGGSNLNIGGNLEVKANGILVLGCEPINFICFNDPDQSVGSFTTRDTVGGDVKAEDALAVVVHLTIIGHNVSMTGGGGGVSSCSSSLPALGGAPPYGDVEDAIIGGDLTITGWQSCWLGFFRVTVSHNVVLNNNMTGDPDGNELATNSIVGNLSCTGNTPNPQVGDSGGGLSDVFGRAHGQCANPKLVR